jgi:hypothetical protein
MEESGKTADRDLWRMLVPCPVFPGYPAFRYRIPGKGGSVKTERAS